MVDMDESGHTLTAADLTRVEHAVDRPLPESYRTFLLATNGGRPRPNLIDIKEAHFSGTVVDVFYGIDDSVEACDVLWNLDMLEGCKENQLLPIASDPYGHLFMLDLSEPRYGQIFYFDSDEIPPRPYFVANDFNEFLGKLRELTPEELADIDAAARGPDEPAPTDAATSSS